MVTYSWWITNHNRLIMINNCYSWGIQLLVNPPLTLEWGGGPSQGPTLCGPSTVIQLAPPRVSVIGLIFHCQRVDPGVQVGPHQTHQLADPVANCKGRWMYWCALVGVSKTTMMCISTYTNMFLHMKHIIHVSQENTKSLNRITTLPQCARKSRSRDGTWSSTSSNIVKRSCLFRTNKMSLLQISWMCVCVRFTFYKQVYKYVYKHVDL